MSFPIPSHIEEDAPSKPQESLPGDDIDAVVKTESVNIPVTLDTRGGSAPGILHFSEKDTPVSGAVVLLSGARGGLDGPSVTLLNIPTLRLDYRIPGRNIYCTPDLLSSLSYLQHRLNTSRFIVIGASFGGAPCFTAASEDDRIVGVATVASQSDEAYGVAQLAPRPLLLIHGTGDGVLRFINAEYLFKKYGEGEGERTLKLFDGDNHSLTKNSKQAEVLLFEFVRRVLGVELVGGEEVVEEWMGSVGKGDEREYKEQLVLRNDAGTGGRAKGLRSKIRAKGCQLQ